MYTRKYADREGHDYIALFQLLKYGIKMYDNDGCIYWKK